MSILDENVRNPVKKFIEYSAKEKKFYWYDKELKNNVEIEGPFYFVCMDQTNVVRGVHKVNKTTKKGIWSNEIHSLQNEQFRIWAKGTNFEHKGWWKDIGDQVKTGGGKFTKLLYAYLVPVKGSKYEEEAVCFVVNGTFLGEWFDFKFDDKTQIVCIGHEFEHSDDLGGYEIPKIKTFKMQDDFLEKAKDYYRSNLQPYFASKSTVVVEDIQQEDKVPENIPEAPKNETVRDEHGIPEPDDDLPF